MAFFINIVKIYYMKKLLVLTLLASWMIIPSNLSAKKKSKDVVLEIAYTFKGVVDGYDHKNKIQVYVDGTLVGESYAKKETEPNSYSISVPKGKHDIKIINLAFYEGRWEEHTEANNYSFDCIVDDEFNLAKNSKLSIVFDLDSGVTYKLK